MEREIFKVQLSINTSFPQRQVLIYNQDSTVLVQFSVTDEILSKMNGKLKAFFYGYVEGDSVHLTIRANDQDW